MDRGVQSLEMSDLDTEDLAGIMDFSYWVTFAIMALTYTIDYFDFFILGFLVYDIGPEWQLSYGHLAAIMLASGAGSIFGALAGGALGDRFGRRPVLISANLICGLASGMVAFLPHGAWMLFSALRFIAGVAIGAVAAVALAYIIERTPKRYRTIITGLNMIAPSAGIALASLVAGTLLDRFGWRGVAALGAAPLVTGLLIFLFVKESAPWLLQNDSRKNHRENVPRAAGRKSPWKWDVFADPRRACIVLLIGTGTATGIYGTYLWGPAIIAMVEKITPAKAARLFLLSSAAGISGKVFFAFFPYYVGRRLAGIISSTAGSICLACAAFTPAGQIAGVPLLMICFLGMAFFLEGGVANLLPYCTEAFPVRLAARGSGLASAGIGIGKILGPLSLTVIAGSGDIIKPKATIDAVFPAFLFLSGCAAVAALALLFAPARLGRLNATGRALTA